MPNQIFATFIAPHQQPTFGDVVGGGGAGDPAHHVVEAADAFEQQKQHQEQEQQQQPPTDDHHNQSGGHGARAFHDHAKDREHIMKDMEGVVNKPESEMSQVRS